MADRQTVAVIFGGKSAEHDVSIITAHIPIIQALEAFGKYDIWPVYIAPDGAWYADKAMLGLDYFQRPGYLESLPAGAKINLRFDNGLQLIWPGLRPKTVKIDLAFPAMHGTYGEDGSLMGLLRMAGVPFVGCDIFASAVAMDKVMTKQVLAAEGLPVVPYVWFSRHGWEANREKHLAEIKKLRWPVFVKPVHLGSSIAVAKAKDQDVLEQAIEVALHYDIKALVEESVEPLIEVTLPMMGNNEIRLAEIERPLNKSELFDFSDKYLSGGKVENGANSQYSELPAQIEPALAEEVKRLGKRSYEVLGCSGIARVDFLIQADSKKIYVNEVNTLPGSLYHHNWRQAGITSAELVEKLIELAEERFAEQQALTHTFKSAILQHVSGAKTAG